MSTEAINAVAPTPATPEPPSSPPTSPPASRSQTLTFHIPPPQRASLDALAQQYGLSRAIILNMLIDLEAATHRLPLVILRRIRTPKPTPQPAVALFQNN